MKLYASEYEYSSIDYEKLVVIEVQPSRFIDLLRENKSKEGFKGVYAI